MIHLRQKKGLTFQEVCKKYEDEPVQIRPRTMRFMPGRKKFYWQVQLFYPFRLIYEKRDHARA